MSTTTASVLPKDYDQASAYNINFENGAKGFVTPGWQLFLMYKPDESHWRTFATRDGFDRFIARKGLVIESYTFDDQPSAEEPAAEA